MSRLTTIAAVLMFIAALLNLAVPVLSGFSAESLPHLVLAAVFALLGWLALKNKRWAVWLSFFATLFGGIVGMSSYLGGGSTTLNLISLGCWVASWLAAACLFVVLWRDHLPVGLSAQKES